MEIVVDPAGLGSAALVATFLVPLVSLIKQPNWRHEAKYLLGLFAALIAAFAGALIDGNITNVSEVIAYFGTAFASAQSLYNLHFTKTNLEAKLADA